MNENQEREATLPCPFCGGPAEVSNFSVHCNNPFCEAQPYTAGQSKREAIAAWNRRAPAAQAAEKLDGCGIADCPCDELGFDRATCEPDGWSDSRCKHGVRRPHECRDCEAEPTNEEVRALATSLFSASPQPQSEARLHESVLVNEIVEQGKFYQQGTISEDEFIRAVNHYVAQSEAQKAGQADETRDAPQPRATVAHLRIGKRFKADEILRELVKAEWDRRDKLPLAWQRAREYVSASAPSGGINNYSEIPNSSFDASGVQPSSKDQLVPFQRWYAQEYDEQADHRNPTVSRMFAAWCAASTADVEGSKP